MNQNKIDRRSVIKTSMLGLVGLSMSNTIFACNNGAKALPISSYNSNTIPDYYPHIEAEVMAEVVGKSHSNLERVKELVDVRPELARSVWEWSFGDFESAVGAASHMGRRDIAQYLISKGARPTIYTFAMLGYYDAIKSIIELTPGIQKTLGPHGISLLNHAYTGERMKGDMSSKEVDNLKRTIDYLESLGDAGGPKYIDVSSEDQKKYIGNYKYGDGDKEGFSIKLNMRKLLSIGPIGEFGGALYKVGDNHFIFNGAPSVKISFDIKNDKVKSLTVNDTLITVTAKKVS